MSLNDLSMEEIATRVENAARSIEQNTNRRVFAAKLRDVAAQIRTGAVGYDQAVMLLQVVNGAAEWEARQCA